MDIVQRTAAKAAAADRSHRVRCAAAARAGIRGHGARNGCEHARHLRRCRGSCARGSVCTAAYPEHGGRRNHRFSIAVPFAGDGRRRRNACCAADPPPRKPCACRPRRVRRANLPHVGRRMPGRQRRALGVRGGPAGVESAAECGGRAAPNRQSRRSRSACARVAGSGDLGYGRSVEAVISRGRKSRAAAKRGRSGDRAARIPQAHRQRPAHRNRASCSRRNAAPRTRIPTIENR